MFSSIFNLVAKQVCDLEKLFFIVSRFPTKKTRLAVGVHGSCAAVNTKWMKNTTTGLCKGRFQTHSHFVAVWRTA